MEVDGSPFATDDRAKLLLGLAADRARRDSTFSTTWKAADGPITLDAAALIAAHDAVLGHVEACFARELELLGQIDAAPSKAAALALQPTVEAFWPQN